MFALEHGTAGGAKALANAIAGVTLTTEAALESARSALLSSAIYGYLAERERPAPLEAMPTFAVYADSKVFVCVEGYFYRP